MRIIGSFYKIIVLIQTEQRQAERFCCVGYNRITCYWKAVEAEGNGWPLLEYCDGNWTNRSLEPQRLCLHYLASTQELSSVDMHNSHLWILQY